MRRADVAEAARDHDRLVIAAIAAVRRQHLEGAEVAGQVGSAELVVVGGGADRAVQHDRQRAGHAWRPAQILLPGLHEIRDAQVGHGEAAQPGLGLAAGAGGGLVTDFAAGAGGRARVRRDAGRVIVRLHLHQQVHRLLVPAPDVVGVREPARGRVPFDHRRVVLVGGQHALRRGLVRFLDHLEQRQRLHGAVHRELGIEDLVPAMLAVDLREHHQLGVGRIAARALVVRGQVVDLLRRQRQTPVLVGALQRRFAVLEQFHAAQLAARLRVEHALQLGGLQQHRLGHRVVQFAPGGRLQRARAAEQVGATAFDAAHATQPADPGDVGGLA
jgi:hypothetical protein